MMARRLIDPSLRRLVGDHGNTAAAAARSPANKFGAKRSDCQHGHKHDSRAEARRCNDLHLMQRGGLISELRTQPQYWFVIAGRQVKHENGRRLGYRADFAYVDTTTGQTIVEDVKGGYRDDAWTLRNAVFRALFPDIDLREAT